MKTKTLKIVMPVIMAIFTVCTVSQVVLASAIPSVEPVLPGQDVMQPLQGMAGKILGLIQAAAGIAAVLLIAVFGFKFIMGSANEKADYQKSFIPLIVGVVVVFAATSIAKLLFGTFTSVG